MGEEIKVTINKCIDYTKAVALVAKNDQLDSRTMYKLTRLNDYSTPPIKGYNKENTRAVTKVNEEIKQIQEAIKAAPTDEEKNKLNEDIKKLKQDHMNAMNDLLDKEDESIKIPTFALSEFTAKYDKPEKGIYVGQSLVPQEFFTLMGADVIKDDSMEVSKKK